MIVDQFNLVGKDYVEIDLYIKTACSNNCKFCFERLLGIDHNVETISDDKMMDIARQSLDVLKSEKCQKAKTIFFKIMGGELFFKSPSTWKYKEFFDILIENSKSTNTNVKFNIVTNLIYNSNNINYIFDLIEYVNSKGNYIDCIGTSFDLYGRFRSISILNLWKTNYNLLLEYCKKHSIKLLVESVVTKQMTNILYNNDISYKPYIDTFNELYNNKYINYDLIRYLKGPKDDDVLDDVEFAEFYKWLIKYYPNFGSVQMLLNKKGNVCYGGMNGYDITNNSYIDSSCIKYSALLASKSSPELDLDASLSNNTMCINNLNEANFEHVFKSYLKYNNCYMCKHFKYCRRDCMGSWLIKSLHRDPNSHYCWLKDIYNYIEDNYETTSK